MLTFIIKTLLWLYYGIFYGLAIVYLILTFPIRYVVATLQAFKLAKLEKAVKIIYQK